jgi:hypothetical protein
VSRRALAPEIVAGLDADAGKDPFNVYGSPADPGNLRWRVDHEMGAATRVR